MKIHKKKLTEEFRDTHSNLINFIDFSVLFWSKYYSSRRGITTVSTDKCASVLVISQTGYCNVYNDSNHSKILLFYSKCLRVLKYIANECESKSKQNKVEKCTKQTKVL